MEGTLKAKGFRHSPGPLMPDAIYHLQLSLHPGPENPFSRISLRRRLVSAATVRKRSNLSL